MITEVFEPLTQLEAEHINVLKELDRQGFSLSDQGRLVLHLEQQLLDALTAARDFESQAEAWERNAADNERRYQQAERDHLIFLNAMKNSLSSVAELATKSQLATGMTVEMSQEFRDYVLKKVEELLKSLR